jgi:hypothetical protein
MNTNAEKLKTEMLKWVWRWKLELEDGGKTSMTFEDLETGKRRVRL